MIDGLIIAALLALAATHLYAQAFGHRTVLHPERAPGAVAGAAGSNGTDTTIVRVGTWTRTAGAPPRGAIRRD
jgi:hypothetical protein